MDTIRDQETAGAPEGQAKRWQDYLPIAADLVETYREQLFGSSGIDIRCEGDAGAGGAGEGEGDAGGDAGGAGGVDLSSPQVQAAIAAAEKRAREAARAELEPHKQQLLDELKPYKGLGKPDEIKQKLAKFEDLETERRASEAGGDPDKWRAAVDAAAKEKADEQIRQYRELDEAKDAKIKELEAGLEESKKASHRRFVENAILKAAMPEDTKIVHDGAWEYIVSTLEPMVVPHEVEGLGTVARLQRNGALIENINGKSPDKLMDLRELFALSRQGKGPVPDLGFCFVSNGAGSGTASPSGGGSGGPGNFHKLTQEQRMKALHEHFGGDTEKYKAWMEESPKPDQKAAGAAA